MMKMFRTDISKQVSAGSSPPTLVSDCKGRKGYGKADVTPSDFGSIPKGPEQQPCPKFQAVWEEQAKREFHGPGPTKELPSEEE
ncbi:hypothetical protein TIFTF001_049293 [Ficus carica]|uniref:Uncharacterized protein n=1 Tax=Ficus carica TaxID=3494 RepID=A0AA88D498_FICCA|nr:hypothetical protein TIFTF001_049293 [Ficus carica]